MYQTLELFEDTFERDPIWSTEGSNSPLPALAVGDIFEHESLCNIDWRKGPEPGQVFKVTAI